MEENKNKKVLKTAIICVIAVMVCVTGFYFGSKLFDKDEDITDNTDNKPLVTSGTYGKKEMKDNLEIYYYLSLRKDGTYLYAPIDADERGISVGKYTRNGDTLTLTDTVRYGLNSCFYTNDLRTYNVLIVDDNKVTITDGNNKLDLVTGLVEDEDILGLTYYVLEPKNGVVPEGWVSAWEDCTNTNK